MWETPKTDWSYRIDESGAYVGDRFNASDYNRIKNNLEYLRGLAVQMYKAFYLNAVSEDKTVSDYFYADEINHIEENLNIINANTLKRSYGDTPSYVANGAVMDFAELNRIESATADLYDRLNNEYEGRRMLTFNFGVKGGF